MPIKGADGFQAFFFYVPQAFLSVRFLVCFDIAEIPVDAPELIAYFLADLLCGLLPPLCEVEVPSPCLLPLCPRLFHLPIQNPILFPVPVKDDLRPFACLSTQLKVSGIRNVGMRTGCIDDQRPFVRWDLILFLSLPSFLLLSVPPSFPASEPLSQ